jgi:hypothetical protein
MSHDIDDEISLVGPTVTSSTDGPEFELNKVHSGSNSGVIVTTTIHRLSRPTTDRKESSEDDFTVGEQGQDFPLRAVAFAPGHLEITEPPRTRIQGGTTRPQHSKTPSFSRPMK